MFGHSNVDVAFNKTRVLGHMRQSPKDLVPTHLTQEWLVEIAVTKTSATHCQSLAEGIVVAFPLVDGVARQIGCSFTLVVRGNHGMWRGAQTLQPMQWQVMPLKKSKTLAFVADFVNLGKPHRKLLRLMVSVPRR